MKKLNKILEQLCRQSRGVVSPRATPKSAPALSTDRPGGDGSCLNACKASELSCTETAHREWITTK